MGDERDSGGLSGSDAARPAKTAKERKYREEVRETTTTTRDEARLVEAEAKRSDNIEAGARLGLDATTLALGKALDRNERLAALLEMAQKTILEQAIQLATFQGAKKKIKKAKLNAEVKKHAIDQRNTTIRYVVSQMSPAFPEIASHLRPVLAKLLPAPIVPTEGATPREAMIRLLATLNDPEDELGPDLLENLKLCAGPDDWPLIETFFLDLAAQPSSPAPAPNGAAATAH